MKNTAQEIRTAIKTQLGFNSTHVSVKTDSYSMGSSVDITIKTVEAYAKLAEIEAIGNANARVRRCDHTNEILSGGNTFVFTKVAESVLDQIAAPYMDAAKSACEQAKANPGRYIEVARCVFIVCYDGFNDMNLSLITGTGEAYNSENLRRIYGSDYRTIAVIAATKGVDKEEVPANDPAPAEEIPAAPVPNASQAHDVLDGVQVDLIAVPAETAPTQSEPAPAALPEPVKVSKIDLAKNPAESLPKLPAWTFTAGFDFQYC